MKTSLSTLPGSFLFKWAILVLPLWVGSDRTEASGLLVFNYWATVGLRVCAGCSRTVTGGSGKSLVWTSRIRKRHQVRREVTKTEANFFGLGQDDLLLIFPLDSFRDLPLYPREAGLELLSLPERTKTSPLDHLLKCGELSNKGLKYQTRGPQRQGAVNCAFVGIYG